MAADLIKRVRKAIMRALQDEDNLQRKALRKAVMLKCDGSGSKDELRGAFAAAMEKLVEKGKVHVEDMIVSRRPQQSTASRCPDPASEPNKEKKRKSSTAITEEISSREFKKSKKDKKAEKLKIGSSSQPSETTHVMLEPPPSAPSEVASASGREGATPSYPPPEPRKGNVSLLLFYAYCIPPMTKAGQDEAIARCYSTLSRNGVSGRLRVGREGFNATLTGSHAGVRAFTKDLREFMPATFGETDFKIVDNQPDNHLLKGLKVWPVTEIVTYGFDPAEAPLDMRGTHLPPAEFHAALANPNAVVIDVRNFNETLIGKFAPPPTAEGADKVLDPCMRRSTEFPKWVDENRHKLEGKQVLMCCTAGVRCERASAFMRKRGIQNVFQLEGGIHRYLDTFPEDGGFWVGKNYTFDKRFSHGAVKSTVVSNCLVCAEPWERYQAQKKCPKCDMEVLVCKTCQRAKPQPQPSAFLCPLCRPKGKETKGK